MSKQRTHHSRPPKKDSLKTSLQKRESKEEKNERILESIQKQYIDPHTKDWEVRLGTDKKNTLFFDSHSYKHAMKTREICGQGAYKFHIALDVSSIKNIKSAIQCFLKDIAPNKEFSGLRYQFKVQLPSSSMREGAGMTLWIPPITSLGTEEKAAALWCNFGLAINNAFLKKGIKTENTTITDKKLLDTEDCIISYRIGPNGASRWKINDTVCFSLIGTKIGEAAYKESKKKGDYNPLNWPDPIGTCIENALSLYTQILEATGHDTTEAPIHKHDRESCIATIIKHYNVYAFLLEDGMLSHSLGKELGDSLKDQKPLFDGFKTFESSRLFLAANSKVNARSKNQAPTL